jgi:putative DNA primase/helicase
MKKPAGVNRRAFLIVQSLILVAAPAMRNRAGFNRSLYLDEHNRAPGMICLLRNIETDEPCGIHRTFLHPITAAKLDRKMLGFAKGAAVKIDADSSVTTSLTIGEGVETLMSARMAGLGPVWALGSSGAVGRFPVLADLGCVGGEA